MPAQASDEVNRILRGDPCFFAGIATGAALPFVLYYTGRSELIWPGTVGLLMLGSFSSNARYFIAGMVFAPFAPLAALWVGYMAITN